MSEYTEEEEIKIKNSKKEIENEEIKKAIEYLINKLFRNKETTLTQEKIYVFRSKARAVIHKQEEKDVLKKTRLEEFQNENEETKYGMFYSWLKKRFIEEGEIKTKEGNKVRLIDLDMGTPVSKAAIESFEEENIKEINPETGYTSKPIKNAQIKKAIQKYAEEKELNLKCFMRKVRAMIHELGEKKVVLRYNNKGEEEFIKWLENLLSLRKEIEVQGEKVQFITTITDENALEKAKEFDKCRREFFIEELSREFDLEKRKDGLHRKLFDHKIKVLDSAEDATSFWSMYENPYDFLNMPDKEQNAHFEAFWQLILIKEGELTISFEGGDIKYENGELEIYSEEQGKYIRKKIEITLESIEELLAYHKSAEENLVGWKEWERNKDLFIKRKKNFSQREITENDMYRIMGQKMHEEDESTHPDPKKAAEQIISLEGFDKEIRNMKLCVFERVTKTEAAIETSIQKLAEEHSLNQKRLTQKIAWVLEQDISIYTQDTKGVEDIGKQLITMLLEREEIKVENGKIIFELSEKEEEKLNRLKEKQESWVAALIRNHTELNDNEETIENIKQTAKETCTDEWYTGNDLEFVYLREEEQKKKFESALIKSLKEKNISIPMPSDSPGNNTVKELDGLSKQRPRSNTKSSAFRLNKKTVKRFLGGKGKAKKTLREVKFTGNGTRLKLG